MFVGIDRASPMQPDLIRLQRLRAWTSGRSRRNSNGWRVESPIIISCPAPGGRRFVAGFFVEREVLGVERRDEVVCQRGHATGITPGRPPRTQRPRQRVYRWKNVAPDDLRDPLNVPKLANSSAVCTTVGRLDGRGCSIFALPDRPTYAQTAPTSPLAEDTTRCWPTPIAWRAPSGRSFRFMYNKLLAANFLDDGNAIWLVDWEYAGIGHPLFDLANLAANGNSPSATG